MFSTRRKIIVLHKTYTKTRARTHTPVNFIQKLLMKVHHEIKHVQTRTLLNPCYKI